MCVCLALALWPVAWIENAELFPTCISLALPLSLSLSLYLLLVQAVVKQWLLLSMHFSTLTKLSETNAALGAATALLVHLLPRPQLMLSALALQLSITTCLLYTFAVLTLVAHISTLQPRKKDAHIFLLLLLRVYMCVSLCLFSVCPHVLPVCWHIMILDYFVLTNKCFYFGFLCFDSTFNFIFIFTFCSGLSAPANGFSCMFFFLWSLPPCSIRL